MQNSKSLTSRGKTPKLVATLHADQKKNQEPTIGFEDVTPDLAKQYMLHNDPKQQRTFTQGEVDRLAEDMSADRWYLTHQGIAFDTNGKLMDGQHRLMAIIKSGATVRMPVARNMPPESRKGLDQQRPRSIKDIMKFDGQDVRHLEVAATRFLAGPVRKKSQSKNAVVEMFYQHQEAVQSVARMFPRTKKRITVAAVLGAMVHAWYTGEVEKLQRFAFILCHGIGPEGALLPEDKAVIMLREWLLRLKTVSGAAADTEIYYKTERALYAYLKGECLTTLYRASKELFPLPEQE